jgi:anti-sigma regulatory factor (Ser/Thr protein kinase)
MLLASFPLISAEPALYWRRAFPGHPDQARAVRQFVVTLLPDRPRLDEVLLAVGELVANALRHSHSGQGGSFTVGVRHAAGCTAVSVTDEGGPAEPVVTDADDLAESGRGLRTISVLADSWGWHGDHTGRTVTVIFAAEASSAVTDDVCRPVSQDDRPRRPPVDAVGDADRTHLGDGAAGRP